MPEDNLTDITETPRVNSRRRIVMGCGMPVTERSIFVSFDTMRMTVAAKTRDFVKNRPYVSEALENNIVNMSQLARMIQKELDLESGHAIKAALRRQALRLKNSRTLREE
ncbi:MAG TPA: hypothetical protein VLV31_04880, partial [Candidatus Acidoferrales bacterium]|nr:hypothetical protein [Candidatus Acidoferrales bacterium]